MQPIALNNSKINESISCCGVRHKTRTKWGSENIKYLICNGHMMGRWTSNFGVNCIADSHDCKEYAYYIASSNENYELFQIDINISY